TDPSASVGLNKMALYPALMAFSKWSLSRAVLFWESKIWVSYPKASASLAAASAKTTNQGLFSVDTTTAIFSFESAALSLAQPVNKARHTKRQLVIFRVILFIIIQMF